MARRLKDGEIRLIKPKAWQLTHITVMAYRIDSETPHVIIDSDGRQIWLTDGEAHDLIDLIGRALAILPTSK